MNTEQFKLEITIEAARFDNGDYVEYCYCESIAPQNLFAVCPYCSSFSGLSINAHTTVTKDNEWQIALIATCLLCKKFVFVEAVYHCDEESWTNSTRESEHDHSWTATSQAHIEKILPEIVKQPQLSPEIPEKYRTEYNEAFSILDLSPKASAALSRRCLQFIIHEHCKIKKNSLLDEINELSKTGLPSLLITKLQAIRLIGNFAAHPLKDTNTGEIIEVEPVEAEWLLDVLQSVFDFYFVQPAEEKARLDSLNEKLKRAGKPQI